MVSSITIDTTTFTRRCDTPRLIVPRFFDHKKKTCNWRGREVGPVLTQTMTTQKVKGGREVGPILSQS